MASASPATLAALLRRSTIVDDEEILQATNAIPKSSQKDPQVIHTRAVALLKLDRFEDAVRILETGSKEVADRCVLEKAYALYKVGRLSDAERSLEEAGTKTRGLKHVAAQVAYRGERFESAAKLYEELSREPATIVGEENDLRINISAVEAQLWWQRDQEALAPRGKEHRSEELEAFETTYNVACSCIARGEFEDASVLLKRARDLCEASEDLSDDEKRAEVLPIMVQQAFVFTKLGNLEASKSLQRMITVDDVPEAPTRAIARNNALAASTEVDNPFMAARAFGQAPILSRTEQHFKHQLDKLHQNKYMLDLQTQKYSGVAHSTNSLLAKTAAPTLEGTTNSLSVLNAAAYSHSEQNRMALRQLLHVLEKRPKDVGLLLTIIQLHTATENQTSALAILEAFFKRLESSNSASDLEVRFAPGLVALAVTLNQSLGRRLSVKTELANASSYWQNQKIAPTGLLYAAGSVLLDSVTPSDARTAGEIFASIRKKSPNDPIAVAGYVASYASTDFHKISSDQDKLKPISSHISGIDINALEAAGIPTPANRSPPVTSKKRKTDTEKATQIKKRKLSKSRMPKDFEPGKQMDPERWLPLRDRSSYRPKGRKGKKKAMDLTQGGVVKEEESLELAGGAGSVKVEKSGGGGGGGVLGGKSKKKKGKK